MRTRCPACSTTFRVTTEQLRLKAGRVRCGHCQGVFNANDSLIDDEPVSAPVSIPISAPIPEPIVEPPSEPTSPPAPQPLTQTHLPSLPAIEEEHVTPLSPRAPLSIAAAMAVSQTESPSPEEDESIAASTAAARAAGLVAARELSETQAYNRWAAGTLAADHGEGFVLGFDAARSVTWPFLLAAFLLFLVLAVQTLFHFRGDITQRWPQTRPVYLAAGVDLPLPRETELVGIEVSDLQADHARGLLVLQATLKNRAAFAQAWPMLELTLTDTQDAVIARRIFTVDDYLPPNSDPQAFAARSELAVRLWLEAKGITAAGYRLYLFYP